MAVIKIKNDNQYKVGDQVWWIDQWGTLRTGIIYEMGTMRQQISARIHENGEKGLCTGARVSDCWPTKEACLDAEKRRSEAQVKEYKESITDVNGLIQFLFDNDVCSEDRDFDACRAAKERAKELLGYEVAE